MRKSVFQNQLSIGILVNRKIHCIVYNEKSNCFTEKVFHIHSQKKYLCDSDPYLTGRFQFVISISISQEN